MGGRQDIAATEGACDDIGGGAPGGGPTACGVNCGVVVDGVVRPRRLVYVTWVA